jgi:biopolymer transport protein ExbB
MTISTARRAPAFLLVALSVAMAFLILHTMGGPAVAQVPAPSSTTSSPPIITPTAPTPSASGNLASQATQEIVENPYSLAALWQGGDFVARGTIIILVVMSMSTWYVLITKIIEQTMVLRQARAANRTFWTAPSIRDGADGLGARSLFRRVVEDGLHAAAQHEGQLAARIDRLSWITLSLQRSVDTIGNRLQGGLAVLATVGSTAPFVGLFGTVWGIYHALTAIGLAGQASIDKVAGPVGEALIMTAIGLAVAVPAVLAYNWMVRRNKHAMDRVRNFSADLLALLVSGALAPPQPVARGS